MTTIYTYSTGIADAEVDAVQMQIEDVEMTDAVETIFVEGDAVESIASSVIRCFFKN